MVDDAKGTTEMTNAPSQPSLATRLARANHRVPAERLRPLPFVAHHGELPIIALTQREVEDLVANDMREGRGGWMVTANLDHLRRMHQDFALRAHVATSDLIVADGMPLVWASRIAGTPLPERIAGSDLIYTLSERAASERAGVFLLGGKDGAPAKAAEALKARYSDLTVTGTLCPEFGFEGDARRLEQVIETVVRAKPALVFVALGFPKQDRLIPLLRARHPDAWYVGVGASVDFVAGFVERSPGWMQKTGTEWLHRMAREPRRLADRYLRQGLPFAARLGVWAFRERFRNRGNSTAGR